MILKQHKKTLTTVAILAAVALVTHISVPDKLFDQPTSTVLNDKDGNMLGARIADDGQWRFPECDTVPEKFAKCIIAYEDRRFHYHLGVDIIAIARAIKNDIKSGHAAEGGSTLTMQTARMARGNKNRTLWQKIVEAAWAIDIEMTHSKSEILSLYASHAPFGGNTVGLDAAAWRYFGRKAEQLSWGEAATLAVLPNSPALIHISRNREKLKAKRDRLLYTLADEGTINKDELILALHEPLPDVPYALPDNAPHLLNYLAKEKKGTTINTTIDARLQRLTQQTADTYSRQYRANHIDNIAAIVLEVETGNVIAYVGNTSDKSATNQVDIIQSERSPGSLLKPLLYTAMMTCGEITPRMLFSDTPLSINGFTPNNFSKTFSGAVHADEAITQSLNVPLVRMLSLHNTGRFMEDLKWAGITTLHYDEDHYGAALILGGAEVTLWDMAHAYRNMAYRLIHYRETDNTQSRMTPSAIWYAFEAMSKLNRPEEEANWQQFNSMKRIAWKTGTSWGARDGWAIGTTKKYVVGVWTGNATGEGRAGLTGVGYAAPVMLDIFSYLDDSEWFEEPLDDMDPVVICRESGCIANNICEHTDTLLMPRRAIEAPRCRYCRLVHTTKDGRWQVNSSCEQVRDIVTEPRFILPAAQEYYYKPRHADYRPLPPVRSDCGNDQSDQIDILYPEHGSKIVIPKGFDGEKQKIVLRAVSRNSKELFWHMDGDYIGSTQGTHNMAVCPPQGLHILTIVDEEGHKRAVNFEIRE